ncbi:MAG: hydrolase [Acidimicrobiaceae bacterium]|nr:hydrolase [Acidimicrobiaceae bacterium]
MRPDQMPWADVVPAEDVDSFRQGFEPAERAMTVGQRPALIVVDMTRAFVQDEYSTGWARTGRPAVAATSVLLNAARHARIPVYFTNRYSDPDYRQSAVERGRGRSTSRLEPPAELPPGDVIVDELAPLGTEVVIHKGRKPSAFFGTPLASYLIHGGVDTVIVAGMTTSGCVRGTALDAYMYNFNVVVPFECTADRSQISHKVSLFDLHMKYADVVSLDEVVAHLARS